ncbi:MAG: caspase domain-containing protein [Elusimicrobiota bacterium]
MKIIMIVVILTAGCATGSRPPAPQSFPAAAGAPLPLRVGVSGEEQELPILDEGFVKSEPGELDRFSQILREAKIFKEVRYPLSQANRSGVDLVLYPRLSARYVDDALYIPKAAVVAFTLTLTAPLFPAREEFSAKARLTVKDGAGEELRQYSESQEVLTAWNLVWDSWNPGARSAYDNVTSRLLQDLINDRPLFERTADRLLAAERTEDAKNGGQARTSPPRSAASYSSDVDVPTLRSPERPDDFALVVGIEKYSNDLPDAQFAERDAEAVRSHLLALGVPERNMKFLTGARATKGNLEAYLEDWLPRNAKEDGRVFFYFSGHGAPEADSGRAYLVPSDGDPKFLDKTSFPLKKLYADLNALKSKRVIVALDSCFSGSGGRSVLAKGARPLVNRVDTSVASGGKLILFSAASADETSGTLEEQGHGAFTYYFLKGIDGGAKDQSGSITLRGIFDYLKPKVQDAASRQNRDQTPVLEGASAGEVLRR